MKIMCRTLVLAAVTGLAVGVAPAWTGDGEGEVLDATRSTVAKTARRNFAPGLRWS